MKKITKIEYQKRNKDRLNIYINEEYAFALDVNILIKYSLKKGMELRDELIEDILESEERINVYNYGIYTLSRSAKCESELRLKMKNKGFEPRLIDKAINRLKEQDYLNDERYCEMFINDKINISKHGILKIKQALYFKGINKEIIEEKLGRISREEEEERAYLLARKKLAVINEEEPRKKRAKISNYLLGRGFEYDVVRRTVSRLLNMEFDDYSNTI